MQDEQLLEFVPGAVYVCDLQGVVVRYNQRAGELWGRYPVAGDPRELYCGSHKLYRANGEPLPHDETPMVDALRTGTSYRNLEVEVEQPSGRRIWIMANIDPLRGTGGEIIGVINCFQDITESKLAQQRQNQLADELNHRVKNTLATIQAIASYTFRDREAGAATRRFEGRLHAISRAHDVLTRESWGGADLRELMAAVSDPLRTKFSGRIAMRGPDLHFNPRLTLSTALALHELCINAVEFGALSTDTGRIDIEWRITQDARGRLAELVWRESLGPSVTPPKREGFGTRILKRTLVREHDATVSLNFHPGGVVCMIGVALP